MGEPEIRQFPGVVGGGRTMIPLRYEDGWDVLTEDGLSFFTPASAREMADDLEHDMAEADAAGHDWNEPHIVETYRMLADLMDEIDAATSARPGSPQWKQECEEFGCHDNGADT